MGEPEDVGARPQGRPPRGGREAGRDHLIESARSAMRSRPKMDVQRREIAEHAGVTPALVSYYFPDKALLLEVAARPVIETYAADVRLILQARAEPKDKLKRVIALFLSFNSEQGFILDHWVEISHAKRRSVNLALLTAIRQELFTFFEELIHLGIVEGNDPHFLPAALWGLCRYVGRREEGDMFQIDERLSASPNLLVCKVLALIST